MKSSKSISILSISLALLLGSTACAPQNNESSNTNEVPNVAQPEETPESTQDPLNRVESNFIGDYQNNKELNNERKMPKDAYIVVNEEETLTLNSYGTVESLPDETYPAEGEIFHSINYTIPDSMMNKVSGSITIDGKEVNDSYALSGSSNLTISAPENAKIILTLSHEGVNQKIDLISGERLSQGIAEAWYQNKNGEITNGFIEKNIKTKNYSVNYKAKITEATKAPYTSYYDWADGGKKTWLMFSYGGEGWGDSNTIDSTQKIEVTDSKGNKYFPDDQSDQYDFVFLVPDNETKFVIHDIHSTNVKDSDDNTYSIPEFTEKATITFK